MEKTSLSSDALFKKIDPTRWIVVWLILAATALDVTLYVVLSHHQTRIPEVWLDTVRGLVFAQTAFLVLTLVWGPRSLALRFVLTGIALAALAQLGASTNGSDPRQWFGGLILYAITLLIPALVTRLSGGRVIAPNQSRSPSPEEPDTNNLGSRRSRQLSTKQFTLLGLLSLTAITGICVNVAKSATFPIEDLWRLAGFFSMLLVSTIGSVIGVLWPQRLPVWLIPLIFLLHATAIFLTGSNERGILIVNLVCCLVGAGILRIAGLRLEGTPSSDAG